MMSVIPQGISPVAHLSSEESSDTNGHCKIVMSDYSLQPRFGCKGPQAASWLSAHGVFVPGHFNSAYESKSKVKRVLQLGQSEFLVEADQETIAELYRSPRQPGMYPVCRQDACIGLQGSNLNALLLQICNVNFHAQSAQTGTVVLTSIAGVSVIAMPDLAGPMPSCLIWCDGTFGSYLWQTLQTIARELQSDF